MTGKATLEFLQMGVTMTIQDDILTISDVANLFKVTEKTLYGLAQKGDLPGFKVGGQWRFQRAAIESWIQVKTEAASSQPISGGAKATGSGLGRSE